jgi:hypothetical protein
MSFVCTVSRFHRRRLDNVSDAVLAEVKRFYGGFLKDVADIIESMSVRFASDDVAVAIVTSRASTSCCRMETKHKNERQLSGVL